MQSKMCKTITYNQTRNNLIGVSRNGYDSTKFEASKLKVLNWLHEVAAPIAFFFVTRMQEPEVTLHTIRHVGVLFILNLP